MVHQTAQREAIRRVFEEASRPLGPPEVLAAAQAIVPRLGLTTVYRTLKSLVQDGWLVVVDLPGEPSRYECATADQHAWFECQLCKRVYQAPGECRGVAALVPPGFELTSYKLVLYGACEDCRETGTTVSKTPTTEREEPESAQARGSKDQRGVDPGRSAESGA